MNGIIYKIRNKINGKCYVGQTANGLERSIRRHAHPKNNNIIAQAIKKYGLQSFEVTVIDTADSRSVLNEKEIHWIAELHTKTPRGYNVANGGNGVTGA